MGRMFYDYKGIRIFEVGFPVGDDAAWFCVIDNSRHYFRSLTAAKSYIAQTFPEDPRR
jgi:hypothetical protein